MKNISCTMPFYVMYQKIMYTLRFNTMKQVSENSPFSFRRPFQSLDTLVDQLHFLDRLK